MQYRTLLGKKAPREEERKSEIEILLPGAIESSKRIIWSGEYIGTKNARLNSIYLRM